MRWPVLSVSMLVACVLSACLLSACKGVDENDFIVPYELKSCRAYRRCATEEMLRTVNIEECLEWFRVQPYPEPPDCHYDREAAEQCLDELPTAGCTDVNPTFPESCDLVYSSCRYPRLPREGISENR